MDGDEHALQLRDNLRDNLRDSRDVTGMRQEVSIPFAHIPSFCFSTSM
jgi:hypothetical protein